MSKKKKYLRKLLAIPLSTAMIAGVGIALSSGISESVLTVNAVESTCYENYTYQLLSNYTICITNYSGNDSVVTIPSIINEKPVTGIGSSAFSSCTSLTSITIPSSVAVSEGAFYNCSNLKNLIVSVGSADIENACCFSYDSVLRNVENVTIMDGVTSIGDCAFSGFEKLTSITIPDSVTSIGSSAFSGCIGLMSITIPDSVTTIGENAFKECTSLESITVSGGIVSIGTSAFYHCNNLTNITISAGSETIGNALSEYIRNNNRSYYSGNYYYNEYGNYVSEYVVDNDFSSVENITIIDGVKSIGDYAFSNFIGLTSVIIPDSVVSVGNGAFDGCKSLTSINIPNNIASIENYTFSDCTNLSSITIPDSVESIGDSTFRNCTSLSSITIPDSVTSIGENAFYECTNLASITMSGGITTIGKDAFYSCNLTNITISAGSETIGNALSEYIRNNDRSHFSFESYYDDNGQYVQEYIVDHDFKNVESITIMNGVKSIGDNAFSNFSGLTSMAITIPDSVTSIGRGVFCGCTNLTSITIPDSVTSIGNWAFSSCTNLTDITLPNSITTIGERTFDSCTNLTNITIPDSVTAIGESAFYECTNLASITMSGGITTIGKDAFYNCNLTNITISAGSETVGNVLSEYISNNNRSYYRDGGYYNEYGQYGQYGQEYIVDHDFKNVESITIMNGVKSISDNAFSNFSGLTSMAITIPDSVVSVGNGAFSGCTNLTSITIPDSVTSIGNWAFSSCTNLTDITLPNGITTVGERTFDSCTNLTNITIPDSVTAIGESAFYRCTNLASITMSGGIDTIAQNAFENCNNLTNLTISAGSENIGSAFHEYIENNNYNYNYSNNNNNVFSKVERIVIMNGVKSIGEYAFSNFRGLTNVTIPDSVVSIGEGAFNSCTSLTNIKLPSSITSIKNHTFDYCTSLTNVKIPDSVTSIENYAFNYCTSLTSIIIPDSVTSIGESAFYECTNLSSITMSGGIATIGQDAFYHCNNLTNLTISAGSATIGNVFSEYILNNDRSYYGYYNEYGNYVSEYVVDNDFRNVKNITIMNGVTSIGDNEFNRFIGLTSVTIPDSVVSVGNGAFDQCTNLTSITIPDSVTAIGYRAFGNCTSLTSITIPDTVMSIEDGTFYNCTSLTSINIPDGITSIGNHVFSGCNKLRNVVIGKNVTSMGGEAFYNCSSLRDIIIPESVISIGERAFCTYDSNSGSTAVIKNLTIYGEVGSFAEQYASDNNIVFKALTGNTEQVIEPTCTEKGYTIYHFTDGIFEDYIGNYTSPIGHDWNDPMYVWVNENTTVIALRTCKNDPNHAEVETAVPVYEVITSPTCSQEGLVRYTAVFKNNAFEEQIKNVTLEKTEHSYVYDNNGILTSDGHKMICSQCGDTITVEHTYDENGICTVCGYEKENLALIDWNKATFEFANESNGLYAYNKKIISPEFTITYEGTVLEEYVDFDFADDSEESARLAGKHTIIIYDKNDENNTFSFDYYIYDLKITAEETADTSNEVHFCATRNADKVNMVNFGIVFDKTDTYGEELSLDEYTHIVTTTKQSTSKYTSNIKDSGSGVWGRPFLTVELNGQQHTVYGNAQYLTRYSEDQLGEPVIQDIVPELKDNKVNIRVEKPIYSTKEYSCKEIGILFSKNGTISSLEEAVSNNNLIYENVGDGKVSKGYVNGTRIGTETVDSYDAYTASISFINDNPVYTRAYVIMTDKKTNEDIIIYGNYYMTTKGEF